MICVSTPAKQQSNGGMEFAITLTLVFGKMNNGKWIFDCVQAGGWNEHNYGVWYATLLNDNGNLDELENMLDKLTENGNIEARNANRATIVYSNNFITEETKTVITFDKERVHEFERGGYPFQLKRKKQEKYV